MLKIGYNQAYLVFYGLKHLDGPEIFNSLKASNSIQVFNGLNVFNSLNVFDGLKVIDGLNIFNGLQWSLKTWNEQEHVCEYITEKDIKHIRAFLFRI